jgi:hypothetical protein
MTRTPSSARTTAHWLRRLLLAGVVVVVLAVVTDAPAVGRADGVLPIYRNEPWHFELRPQAVSHGCPPMYANPTQDPRLQR